jgi:hypothetical protein
VAWSGAEDPLAAPDGAGFGMNFGKHERMRQQGAALFERALLARSREQRGPGLTRC